MSASSVVMRVKPEPIQPAPSAQSFSARNRLSTSTAAESGAGPAQDRNSCNM
ncbi:hypothetical protein [Oceanibium sediminis]|uniref:hypothetical protein n=1 Tax=Oceanibium sediminis TaxID=2026339 RepID=UPI0018E59625|nr:hypothetical protein [Oceanibium sediminis]